MRVKIMSNLGDDWPEPWLDGEEHDCGEDLGNSLIAKGLAVRLPDSAAEQATKVANQKPPAKSAVPTSVPQQALTPKTFGQDPHEADRMKQQAAKDAPVSRPAEPPYQPEQTKNLGKGKGHSGNEPK